MFKQSLLILSFILFGFSTQALENFDERNAGKRERTEMTASEVSAVYICHELQKTEDRLYKVKVHKLAYFANGLHYILTGQSFIEEPFEAHQYGTFSQRIQNFMNQELSNSKCTQDISRLAKTPEILLKLEPFKAILDVTLEIFKKFTSINLSNITHEPSTPWNQVRKRWNIPLKPSERFRDMNIPQNWDKEYFLNPDNVLRFYLLPYIRGEVETKGSKEILSGILERCSGAFDIWISSELLSISEFIETEDCDVMILQTSTHDFLQRNKGLQTYSDVFRNYLGAYFIHSAQSVGECLLSSVFFDYDFIDQNENQLFYDRHFRVRTAFAAQFGNISALYYLKRIFETFSDREGDLADTQAKNVDSKLKNVAQRIMDEPKFNKPSWQSYYEKALASFYCPDQVPSIHYIDQALCMRMPTRYYKDLLKRAYYLTADKKYICVEQVEDDLKFKEFYMYKAVNAENLEEAFSFFEIAIMNDVPEAFFEAGKSILRHHYVVSKESPLWEKFNLTQESRNPENNENLNTLLGERLLQAAIGLNVHAAFELLVDHYRNHNLGKVVEACNHMSDGPFKWYQLGKVKEKQCELQEAIEAYKKAGPLLGYLDAARLETEDEEKKLLEQYKEEKNKILEELWSF